MRVARLMIAAIGAMTVGGLALAETHYVDQKHPRAADTNPAGESIVFEPLDPAAVKVGGEIGRRIEITVRNHLLALDVDGLFLKPFRQHSGGRNGYIGYGKLLDAAVSFARYTNDARVVALKDRLANELIATQSADGYIGIFPPKDRLNLEKDACWDLHEIVYIIHALVNNYRHFGDQPSLDAARKLGDCLLANRQRLVIRTPVNKLDMERALIALSEATGHAGYADFAIDNMKLRAWKGGPWPGGHAYCLVNTCLAQLDLCLQRPDPSLLISSRNVIGYLPAGEGVASVEDELIVVPGPSGAGGNR